MKSWTAARWKPLTQPQSTPLLLKGLKGEQIVGCNADLCHADLQKGTYRPHPP
jgi:hypothetical protein